MSGHLNHRQAGYELLTGHGLEIGAFHQPAIIPSHCTVEYCDAQSREDVIQYFPELDLETLVHVDYICDLDQQGLSIFESNRFNFVILNHVIEHVANPIKIIAELFRIIQPKGYVVISAPDKNFTFDRKRPLTPFIHLKEEYENNVTEVTDAHYLDFLQGVHPEVLQLGPEALQVRLNSVRKRREHAHVWNSQTFTEFMQQTLELLKLEANCIFISLAETNHLEYFSIWQK